MYYEVRSWRKHPMLSCLTSDQRADQGGAVSLGPGDVSCARVCTCWCCGRGSNANRGGVVGRMCVDSGAVQCHVLMRARVGVRVGSHSRPAIQMRKKEASRCKVCAPANGCMLARVHGVQCVPSSYVRTAAVKCRSKNSRGKQVARAAGWARWTCRTMWSGNGSSQDRRWRGPHVWGLGVLVCGLSEVSQLIVNGHGYAMQHAFNGVLKTH
jgi:hypothetical protein